MGRGAHPRADRGGRGVFAIDGGEKRIGWGAIFAGVVGLAGGYAATQSGVSNLEQVVVWGSLGAATLRYATPLIFGALGGLFSERSGVINIALEGMMLMGAFFGAFGADKTGSWVLGLLIAMAAGALFGLLHALFAVSFRADQIVSGTALNLLAVGITGYLYVDIYGNQGTPDDLPAVPDVHLPIKALPLIGDLFGQLNLLVWLALAMVAGDVGGRVPHVDRPAPALRGREPAGRRDRGPQRRAHALPGRHDLGRAGRAGRGVPVDRLPPHVLAEHDRGSWLHRPGGADLRPLATRRRRWRRRCCSASAPRSRSGCRSSRRRARCSSRRCRTC